MQSYEYLGPKTHAEAPKTPMLPHTSVPVDTYLLNLSEGPKTYQLLQSTRMISPGLYVASLCTQGQSSSATQPPFPSATSPEGHTQPETHCVLNCRHKLATQGLKEQPVPSSLLGFQDTKQVDPELGMFRSHSGSARPKAIGYPVICPLPLSLQVKM